MRKLQSVADFLKKPKAILAIILLAFFLKGVFVAAVFPIFTGQDEARHYSSLQYLAEPFKKNWKLTERKAKNNRDTIADYNFSEEIINTGLATDFDTVRHKSYNTADFSQGFDGKNEAEINSGKWQPFNFFSSPDTAGRSLYHTLGSKIEKSFASSSILVRFFLARIFSVFLGTLAVLFAYLIAKNIGFKEKYSLTLTAIVSFQPKLAMYSANINYDTLLIPLFFLFTFGAVLSFKNGLNWKNAAIMLFSIAAGIPTKGTAIVLLAVFIILVAYHLYEKMTDKKNVWKYFLLFSAGTAVLLIAANTKVNLVGLMPYKESLANTFALLLKYINKSLTLGQFGLSSRTYWGALDWNSGNITTNIIDFVWIIQTFSIAGLAIFFFSKKKFDFLPEKKYVVFLISMLATLQLGIRIFDWKVYMESGSLDLGTPGRYFLPNLAAHIILVFIGLGALLKKEKYFEYCILAGMILMFAFSTYLIFNVVIPRFYL
ncbi:MAG: 2 protein [Patescibacteria group bacterium]|nr:2 protein [Patescibacteria group bacterium]